MNYRFVLSVTLALASLAPAQPEQGATGGISPFFAPNPPAPTPQPPTSPASGMKSTSANLLYEMSVSSDPAMRMRALEAWGASDAPEALTQVMNGLLDPDSRVRDVAVLELENFGAKRVFDFVMGLLAEGDYEAVSLLHNALPSLKNQLEDRFLSVFQDEGQDLAYRRAAAYALGRMGSQKATEGLIHGAWSEYPEFAYTCAEALYNVRDSKSLPAWYAMLGHPNDAVRHYALYGICTTGNMEALKILREVVMLQIPLDPQLQIEAARCINAWPAENAIPIMIEAMQANRTIGRVCAEQLAERTGLDFGDFPSLWLAWWQEVTAPPPPQQTDE